MKDLPISVIIVSTALLGNIVLAVIDGPAWAVLPMFLAGPFLMVWMVLHVLKDDPAELRDLKEGEEWGYQDRPELRAGRDRSG